MATVTETTCLGCGATYATVGTCCPLCGTDPRHAIVRLALTRSFDRWATIDETATAILAALDAMGADDAVQ